ncbi:MAG: glycoside hydrolase family 172 protein, partial [Phycisphaerae bacterium]
MSHTHRFGVWVLVICSAGYCDELADIATIVDRTTHRASSYDRSGGNEDAIVSFAPDTAHVLMEADGPGRVTHIWMTVGVFPNHTTFLRDLVLRAYWERSRVPSVEVPLGDFFALGHCKRYLVQSIPVAVGANPGAMNCYWPMPFHKHARIEICNAGGRSIRKLYYHVDYELGSIPPDQGLFHAVYRRDKQVPAQAAAGNTTGAGNYVILDTAGEGQYVGCVLSVDAQPGGWWGEG